MLDSPINLSDHLCIEICIRFCSYASNKNSLNNAVPSTPGNNFIMRDWSLRNRRSFYDQTRCHFIELHDRIVNLYNNSKEYDSVKRPDVILQIDALYNDIVAALLDAANLSMPIIKPNVRKAWWDDSLNILKSISIDAHNNWVESGRLK